MNRHCRSLGWPKRRGGPRQLSALLPVIASASLAWACSAAPEVFTHPEIEEPSPEEPSPEEFEAPSPELPAHPQDPAFLEAEAPQTNPPEPCSAKYQQYFQSLNLPYREPLECGQAKLCQIAEDFNGDEKIELAKLYVYSGSKYRIDNNYVDLVIFHCPKGSDQPTHQTFLYVGAIDHGGRVLASLERQPEGEFELPLGTITLDNPGINVRRDDQAPGTYFPTYYWTGEKFSSIDKSAD